MATTKEETRSQAEVNPNDPYENKKSTVSKKFKDEVRKDSKDHTARNEIKNAIKDA